MSAFDDWLADNSKTRDTAAALDEITWLRLERQRLMDATLTAAERRAIQQAIYCCEDITYGGPANEEAAVTLSSLLERTRGTDAVNWQPLPEPPEVK